MREALDSISRLNYRGPKAALRSVKEFSAMSKNSRFA